jgi:hypothetical protein
MIIYIFLCLTTLVVIGTDCIGIYKSNYHTMTTTMAPEDYVTGSGTALIYYQIDIYFSNIYITIFTLFFFIFYLINVRIKLLIQYKVQKSHRGCHRMVVGFINTYAISAYHH